MFAAPNDLFIVIGAVLVGTVFLTTFLETLVHLSLLKEHLFHNLHVLLLLRENLLKVAITTSGVRKVTVVSAVFLLS